MRLPTAIVSLTTLLIPVLVSAEESVSSRHVPACYWGESTMSRPWLAPEAGDDWLGEIVRGQNDGGSQGNGAGAAAAVDPSVPLVQMQFQNTFIPSTYGATGYSNQFVLQPVLPVRLNSEFFPYHIVRPTLPIVAPTADPDGPLGRQGGLGDLTLLDAYTHPIKHLKTNVGIGYVGIVPTATHPQLGLGEWQLGPAAYLVSTAVPKWVLGAIYQQPISLESCAYTVQVQPIATRLLPNQWYVGWGDALFTVDNQTGDYRYPINARVGKVIKLGQQPLNIFVQPSYTPEELYEGSSDEWSVKLSVSFLFPKAKIGPLLDSDCRRCPR